MLSINNRLLDRESLFVLLKRFLGNSWLALSKMSVRFTGSLVTERALVQAVSSPFFLQVAKIPRNVWGRMTFHQKLLALFSKGFTRFSHR